MTLKQLKDMLNKIPTDEWNHVQVVNDADDQPFEGIALETREAPPQILSDAVQNTRGIVTKPAGDTTFKSKIVLL